MDFEVDRKKSALSAFIHPTEPGVTWKLEIECTDRYVPDYMQPAHLEGPPMASGKGWRELASETFTISYNESDVHPILPDNPCNIYVGWHAFPNHHKIRLLERKQNSFLIDWKCEAKETKNGKPEPIQVLAEIPFTELIVWSRDNISLEAAKLSAARHFDLSDFHEPVREHGDFGTEVRFRLRTELD